MPAWIKVFQVQKFRVCCWARVGASCVERRRLQRCRTGTQSPFPPQVVARGASHAILLKFLPLPLAQLLTKFGLLNRFSPFCRASTQSLAEVLKQLGASSELQAVLSYIFPTYGG